MRPLLTGHMIFLDFIFLLWEHFFLTRWSHQKKRPCNRKQTCPIIVRIRKIRDRQGGPTSSLLREELKDSRNVFISEVVSYLSFEDVKSKFSLQRKARCTPVFYNYMACKYFLKRFFDVDEARYPTMVERLKKKVNILGIPSCMQKLCHSLLCFMNTCNATFSYIFLTLIEKNILQKRIFL